MLTQEPTPLASAETLVRLFDQQEYRSALGTFTTGVTIVTACGQGTIDGADAENRVGITANSFNSVSLDPPLVLWSLAKSSSSAPVFEHAEYWAVHILSHDQEALANRFAKRGIAKFAGLETEKGLGGIPLLPACTTRMQCKTAYRYDGGDHIIMVGEVMHFDHSDLPPLVYQRGNYAIATRKELADEAEALIKATTGARILNTSAMSHLLGSAYFQLYGKLREFGAQQGLNDTEFFILNTLAARDGLSIAELNRLFAYAGHSPLSIVLDDLTARGLLQVVTDHGEKFGNGLFYLTAMGKQLAQKIAEAGSAIEADMMKKMGTVDAIALRTLLRRFINIPGDTLSLDE
ncbi:flavin reductase [Glaciimonas immobilis]|uniref:3-hydroxy-9,10-secoandrosta-1,3,5(10)-triene-9, 17-dione monooxygenase reductase component n=1 Tax=Glaciimonas immobilis TaxID=728004 RepID=A0A840RXM4_9BURK|nr:flavin reductase [Glaciimonas immobilis]KAF3996776.1 flavin reductase [Glaciimonas immobilis]MBB5201291.1 3-hydroxy-9,10-secoandrosta-1,3,5(10)-triene-9,17-dione monooxygenase reductase component [Glaciimonas immobilis]